MGKIIYVPDVIESEELDAMLADIRNKALKVDHSVIRGMLLEVCSELNNEIHNIESGCYLGDI